MQLHTHSSATHSPHSHALLDVSGCHLVAQVHHKLGKLLDIDDVLGVLGVGVDDLGASVTERSLAFQHHMIRYPNGKLSEHTHTHTHTHTHVLPCDLQWLFALQGLFIRSQIPQSGWRQPCIRLLNAYTKHKPSITLNDHTHIHT